MPFLTYRPIGRLFQVGASSQGERPDPGISVTLTEFVLEGQRSNRISPGMLSVARSNPLNADIF
jgi:hypothetical protein